MGGRNSMEYSHEVLLEWAKQHCPQLVRLLDREIITLAEFDSKVIVERSQTNRT